VAIALTDQAEVRPPPTRWIAPARHPRLAPGAVDVWRADLANVADELTGLLSVQERARSGRFPRAGDGELWARSRGVLRALLGRYLTRDPRELQIAESEHGKPALLERAGSASERLCFNLSHSGEIALYAFTASGPVGVDVELAGQPRDAPALAARAFGPAAAARLQRLDPAGREREFLRAWVRHEAALKCLGTGIGGEGGAGWIAELPLGARGAGAVALTGVPSELRCWDWS
jgi:4'-phosphopantetheinyl transferase